MVVPWRARTIVQRRMRRRASRPQLKRDSLGGAAGSSSDSSTSLRTVVLFNLGPSFGGVRMAVRPGTLGLDDAEAFAAIEAVLSATFARIEQNPNDEWSRLRERLTSDASLPSFGARSGSIEFTGGEDLDGTRHLIARCFLPFRAWPLGGWAVYDGRLFAVGGKVTPFTQEELGEVW